MLQKEQELEEQRRARRQAASSQSSRWSDTSTRSNPTSYASWGARQQELDAKYDTDGDSLEAIFGDFLGEVGKEVVGPGAGVEKAKKVGEFVLEEFLDYLEGNTTKKY
eukprot:5185583-Amphidinium_carterae.1